MTSIDFLNKVHKSLDSQEYNLSYCGSSLILKMRYLMRMTSVRLWIFGRMRTTERLLLRGWNT